jgi:hypothetical protein
MNALQRYGYFCSSGRVDRSGGGDAGAEGGGHEAVNLMVEGERRMRFIRPGLIEVMVMTTMLTCCISSRFIAGSIQSDLASRNEAHTAYSQMLIYTPNTKPQSSIESKPRTPLPKSLATAFAPQPED